MSDDARREARGAMRGVPGARHDAGGAKFDDAIDRAVREMLDLEPPAGLRGRVLDRIDALPINSVASAFLGVEALAKAARRNNWWLAAPIAAAAVVMLAVLAPWRQATPRAEPPAAPSLAQMTPAPVPPPVASQNPQPPRTTLNPAPPVTPTLALSGPRPSPRAVEDRGVVATVAADDDASVGIEPLAPIDLITVAAARPRDIGPKEIAISPLAPIAELQIAPLSPPTRRN